MVVTVPFGQRSDGTGVKRIFKAVDRDNAIRRMRRAYTEDGVGWGRKVNVKASDKNLVLNCACD